MIETERLLLRPFVEQDLEEFARFMADPEVMRFSVNGPLTREQAKELLQERIIKHYTTHGFSLYAVIHKKDRSFIGGIGLITQEIEGEIKVELGYRLDPHYWGQGLATEAAQAVCHYAFTQLHLTELISIIDPHNIRSLSVAKRVRMLFWKESLFHQNPVHIYLLKNMAMSSKP